jgi:hypothetical protein
MLALSMDHYSQSHQGSTSRVPSTIRHLRAYKSGKFVSCPSTHPTSAHLHFTLLQPSLYLRLQCLTTRLYSIQHLRIIFPTIYGPSIIHQPSSKAQPCAESMSVSVDADMSTDSHGILKTPETVRLPVAERGKLETGPDIAETPTTLAADQRLLRKTTRKSVASSSAIRHNSSCPMVGHAANAADRTTPTPDRADTATITITPRAPAAIICVCTGLVEVVPQMKGGVIE